MAISPAAGAVSIEDLRLFSVEDFDRMVEVGILGDEERVELLEGHRRGDRLVVPAFPDVTLTVEEILGPALGS